MNEDHRSPSGEPAWPTGEDPDLAKDSKPGLESTGAWTPDWDDDTPGKGGRGRAGASPPADRTRRTPPPGTPPAGGRQWPPPAGSGRQRRPPQGTPGPPRARRQRPPAAPLPQQRPPEHQTEMMPLVLDDMHRASPNEPQLLTHRDTAGEQRGGGSADAPALAAATGGGGGGRPPRGPGGPAGPGGSESPRRRRWRRARRTLYVLIGLGIVLPAIAFFVAYQVVSVPSPEAVVARHNQPITYYWANGNVMYKDFGKKGARKIVQAKDIPERVKHAVFAAEDATFETNAGFDIKGIMAAALHHLQGGGGGGSTITQQYVKKATGNDQYSYVRKALEIVRAFKLTNSQSKSDILTGYLNIVYFGRGAHGISAAAKAYFNTDVQHLTAEQAAYLAGLIQGPSRGDDEKYVRDRWSYVMDQMESHHWISRSERQSAKLPKPIPYVSQQKKAYGGKLYLKFITNRVDDELKAQGLDMDTLRKQGAKIYLGIDPEAEQKAVAAAHEVMGTDHDTAPKKRYKYLASALVSADPSTGQIIAYYGGNWKKSHYDLAGTIPHSPGSSFKPIDFAAAMRNDPSVGIGTTYDGTNHQHFPGVAVPINNADGDSCGKNCSVMQGMTRSVNTVFYNMVYHMKGGNGPQKVRKMAYDLGIAKKQYGRPGCDHPIPSLIKVTGCKPAAAPAAGIAIGQYPVTVRDMAQAYATLANKGNRIPLHFVTKVTDSSGKNVLYRFSQKGKQVIDPGDPRHGAKIARNVIESMLEVAKHSHVPLKGTHQVAAKTGTAGADPKYGDQNKAAWMVGFTPRVVTAVWTGDRRNNGHPIHGAYKNYLSPSKNYRIFGREEPSFIWRKFMDAYLKGKAPEKFSPFEPAALGDSTPTDWSVPGVHQAPASESSGEGGDSSNDNGGHHSSGTEPPPSEPPHHHHPTHPPSDTQPPPTEPTEPTAPTRPSLPPGFPIHNGGGSGHDDGHGGP